MFEHVEAYAGDPILSLNEDFQKDPRPGKVNLSIGIYFDESGRLPMMQAVREAEMESGAAAGARPYLPMAGLADYRRGLRSLVLGGSVGDERAATLQTLGASGALKVGADFLRRWFPTSGAWISDPSWENHRVVFEGAGFAVRAYPYYDPATGGLRFDDMAACLRSLPPHSVVLLHACCHNPTGVDLTAAQWDALIPLFLERELIAFIDMAYQGFGDDVDGDAYAPRAFAAGGVPTLIANSFSKNFSLYGERCGGLTVVCRDGAERERVEGQLMSTVRANYSNPPTHGATVIARVLADGRLRDGWLRELTAMRERIRKMRLAIHEALAQRGVRGADLSRYLAQRGMFTYTGLSAERVERLRAEHGVYLLRSGRMCVAGLNAANVATVADAIAAVTRT